MASSILVSVLVIAGPQYAHEVTYYNDSAHSYVIGKRTYTCAGRVMSWGKYYGRYSEDVITKRCY